MTRLTPVTGLYVPGDRPDRFAKATGSGAELIVFDWEDAVAGERRQFAREEVARHLAQRMPTGVVIQVRVNAGEEADLAAVAELPPDVEIRLPKVRDLDDVERASRAAPGRPITALLEDAAGVLAAAEICAHPAVTRAALGEADLRAELGPGRAVRDHARIALVYAAAAAGLEAPMLSVHPAIDDPEALLRDTVEGAANGFGGRMAVHPRQLPTIREAFRPSEDELRRAREVLDLTARTGVARTADGAMVDAAMRREAERILRRAGGTPAT